MPLTALLGGVGVVSSLDDNFKDYKNKDLTCRECGARMIVVSGLKVVNHFRHKHESNCSASKETISHLKMKLLFSLMGKKEGYDVKIEHPIDKFRVDVLIDNYYAVEIQTSPCTKDYIDTKNELYKELGYHPVWIFFSDKSPKETRRLNSLLKKIFNNWDGSAYTLSPWAFMFFSKTGEFVLPYFEREKVDCSYSETKYINEYKLVPPSKWITPNDFLSYLDFYMKLAKSD